MQIFRNTSIYTVLYERSEAINTHICKAFARYRNDPDTRRSHYFGGRHENIYVDRHRIPGIDELLTFADACVRQILGKPEAKLCSGYWFNEMGPGETTLPHSHDDDDELLSGVYYLRVPPASGNLIILENRLRTVVEPQEGLMVFFNPHVLHEVSPNRSGQSRLSLAFNIGPG